MTFEKIKSELVTSGNFTEEEVNAMGTLAVCFEWMKLPTAKFILTI